MAEIMQETAVLDAVNRGAIAPLLQVKGLTVTVPTSQGPAIAVDGINFEIAEGETLCLVGESASGKSLTALSLLGLQSERVKAQGAVRLRATNLFTLKEAELCALRGREIAMIFQEPIPALNPVHTIGRQLAEALCTHQDMALRTARSSAVELLEQVGFPAANTRLNTYPHQLSGGMAQRVMIAMALAMRPALLVADEPTTALDVTIQAQILDLLDDLRTRYGMAMLLITHDIGVVAEMADRVAVMYAGHIVECAPVLDLFKAPYHPYTQALLAARARFEGENHTQVIHGEPPSLNTREPGCPFAPRCPLSDDLCRKQTPPNRINDSRSVACHYPLEA